MNKSRFPVRRSIGVIDLFCGCGGASVGFRRALESYPNAHILGGVDIDSYCCASYESIVGAPALQLDLCEAASSEAVYQSVSDNLKINSVDDLIVIGCSPCQGFSAHRASHGGLDKRRDLFAVLCDLIRKLRPTAFFIENVPDLVSKKHWPHFSDGVDSLVGAGYSCNAEIHNFAEFGLPQERFRVTIVGSLDGHVDTFIPKRLSHQFATVRDAIGHLEPLNAGEASQNDMMHRTSSHRQSTLDILRLVPRDGGNRPLGVGPVCLDRARERHGGYTDVYGRMAWGRPAVTITSRCRTPSCGRFAHPQQDRGLTPREAANLQGFPPDAIFIGPFDDLYKQIGNAVSPLISEQFAARMLAHISGAGTARSHLRATRRGLLAPIGPGFAVKINGIKRKRDLELFSA